MAQQGGKRAGAGRPKGAKDKLTREAGATISELARKHTKTALDTLVSIAINSDSDPARVSAANALLDRAYGKPMQGMDHTSSDRSMSPSVMTDADLEAIARGEG